MVHSAALRNLDVAQALQISEGKQKTALQHPQVALYVWASVELTWLYFDIMHPKNHSMVSFQMTSCHQIMRCVCWHTSATCQTASRILCNLQCWMNSIVSVCYCCSICSKYVPLATVLYVALWFLWIDCVCRAFRFNPSVNVWHDRVHYMTSCAWCPLSTIWHVSVCAICMWCQVIRVREICPLSLESDALSFLSGSFCLQIFI